MLLAASSSISAIESVEHFEAIKETLINKQRDVEEFCLARKIANKRVIISLVGEEESKLDSFASCLKNILSKYKIAHVKREDNRSKWINTLNNLFEENSSNQVIIIQSAEMQNSNKSTKQNIQK